MSNNKNKDFNQNFLDTFVSMLGNLAGAKVMPSSITFEELRKQEAIRKQNEDLQEQNNRYLKLICKLLKFYEYRQKWRNLTRQIERREKRLIREKLNKIPDDLPEGIKRNLAEAYQSFVMGNTIASYIMILRTVELAITPLYEKENDPVFNKHGREIFVGAFEKLSWAEKNKIIGGLDIKIAQSIIFGRNDSIHEIYIPEDLQVMAAFDIVLKLLKKIDFKEKKLLKV